MRKLATIRKVAEKKPIPGADRIEAVRVDGWWCVGQKDVYQVDQLVVYFEVDSFIPTTVASFLTKDGHEPREFNGVKGERLKTIKLKGQLSQGLLLPLTGIIPEDYVKDGIANVGDDLTEMLGIQLWERPENGVPGQSRSNWPHYLRKTDQERVQNLPNVLEDYKDIEFQVTTKLDGSSCTMYFLSEKSKYWDGEPQVVEEGKEKDPTYGRFGVCSRNVDLKETEGNAFWGVARKYDVENKLKTAAWLTSLAIQGELVSPTIQKNYEKVSEPDFYVFDIFNIEEQAYMRPSQVEAVAKAMGLKHVPILSRAWKISEAFKSIDEILKYAEGPGMNPGVSREGVVFKQCDGGDFSFKAISNTYLVNEKDE